MFTNTLFSSGLLNFKLYFTWFSPRWISIKASNGRGSLQESAEVSLPPEQIKFGSILHNSLHPSPLILLLSSHSYLNLIPSPHFSSQFNNKDYAGLLHSVQLLELPEQVLQIDEHFIHLSSFS